MKDNAISLINESGILNSDDLQVLVELKEELRDTFLYSQVFRTRTEMEMSVLNNLKHPTPDSKYWQAMREQNVMLDQTVMLSYEYRKNLIEIKKLERDLSKENDDLERELIEIEIEKKRYVAKQQERTAKDRIREIQEWHDIKEKLKPQMKHSQTDVNEHQLLSYTARLLNQMQNIHSMTAGEKNNIVGQLNTSIDIIKSNNLESDLLALINPNNQDDIKALLEI